MATAGSQTAGPPGAPRRARALALARRPKLWLFPGVLCALVAALLSLLYLGGIVNPTGHLHRLPIALVNADQAPPPPGQPVNLGTQLTRAVVAGTPDDTVRWRQTDDAGARDLLAAGKVYGVLLVPADFTATVTALAAGGATHRPTLTVLTNPGLGSLGSSIAAQIAQNAAHQASVAAGQRLLAAVPAQGGPGAQGPDTGATARLLLADPFAVATQVGHPIGSHSGLGLSAFYFTLLAVLTGFIGGNIIHNGVDTALGYSDSEIGPWHTRRPTVPVSRTQTLMLKMLMTAGIMLVTTSLVLLCTAGILGMDAPHQALLWVFAYCASLAVGLGVQAINAAFGGIGQLVSMFVFIALALPSSGATVPLQAVPGFYRFLAVFEPMRQLSDGIRAILFFDARSDAGLARGWVMIAIGVALALAFGFGMTRYYDRKGLHRWTPQPSE
ncbi:YhgE/Pip domain-containing protein [Kitasatospora sp. NPDC059160]|uniref:YhgE/Pip domain-containing protein n=1 Tax=Kitasatospora sp. NPDC059160 TaxID=3346748 RepID=UPI003691893C